MDVMRINNEIHQAVTKYFTVEELNQSALGFIQYKLEEGTPFGHLTVLHYFMFGGKSCEIYRVSAAIELMILSLDILDDLQDQDDFSKPWTQMDPSLSLNVATGFLLLSNEMLLQTSFEMNKKLKVLEYFNTRVIQAVNGQHVDLLNSMTSEQEYIQVVKLKSGALVAVACTVGTVLATEDHHHIVKEYAEYIGIAAQIKNDMKDFLEKVDWRDVMHKKRTLPILFALQNDQPAFQILRHYYEGKCSHEILFTKRLEIMEAIQRSGVLQYCHVMIRVYQLQAMDLIRSLNMEPKWEKELKAYL